MDRNLIYALIMSVVIVVAFSAYQQYAYPPRPGKPVTPADATRPKPPIKPPEVERTTNKPAEQLSNSTSPVRELALTKPTSPETKLKVDTPLYEADLSSKGGRIVSFKLKKFKVNNGRSDESDNLVNLYDPHGPDTGGPRSCLRAHPPPVMKTWAIP